MNPFNHRSWKSNCLKVKISNLNSQKLTEKIVTSQIKIIFKMINLKKSWNQNKIQKYYKNLIKQLRNKQKNK
jgi:hypothetical protein